MTSGILTNVFEIATAILSASDAWRKRRGETVVLPGLAHHGILRDVLSQLRQKGWTQSKQLNPTGESFLMEKKPPGKAPNTPRVSDAIIDWIQSEELCDFDLYNHTFCRKTTRPFNYHLRILVSPPRNC